MDQINELYRQRNNLAIAFCKAALAAGWKAGRGIDTSKPDGDPWANVVYVVLPGDTQVSWHIAPSEVHLLDGIPEFEGNWDGSFTARDKNWPDKIPTEVMFPEPKFVAVYSLGSGLVVQGPDESKEDFNERLQAAIRGGVKSNESSADPCTNCLRPKSEHNGKHCPSPFTTVWHAWDYPFAAGDER